VKLPIRLFGFNLLNGAGLIAARLRSLGA